MRRVREGPDDPVKARVLSDGRALPLAVMAAAGLAHPEHADGARPDRLDGLVHALGLGHQDADARLLQRRHRAAADPGAEDRLYAAALERAGRVAVAVAVGGVGQNGDLAAVGVHEGEERRSAPVAGHRGLEPFVSVGGDADLHRSFLSSAGRPRPIRVSPEGLTISNICSL